MDDQQAYLLNGLLSRSFGLGRIVRFRKLARGRQAETYELFTAQEKEYLAQVYPPAFDATQLEFAARTVNAIDVQRFSVVPFLASKSGPFVADGPQNGHLLVSLAPAGSAFSPDQLTDHDVSQVGLRLAWMHRLFNELLPAPEGQDLKMQEVQELAGEPLLSLLRLPAPRGWVHGDIQLPALLHDGDHQLRTLVDWGLIHYGCPFEDLADAFIVLARDDAGKFDINRGRILLEAYDSLVPIRGMAWTPVAARWCAQRLLDDRARRRPAPAGFAALLAAPESLATAMASCT